MAISFGFSYFCHQCSSGIVGIDVLTLISFSPLETNLERAQKICLYVYAAQIS